jgi:hypothetical protein
MIIELDDNGLAEDRILGVFGGIEIKWGDFFYIFG